MENNIDTQDKQEAEKLKKAELKRNLDEAKINPLDDIIKQHNCLSIINNDGTVCDIGTLGDFSVVIGKAKSRKTFVITIVVSATIKNEIVLNRIQADLPVGKDVVLYFDTEQSRHHVQKAVDRICRITQNANPAKLICYGLRKYTPQERLELIEYAIYNTENIGFVVIDGIKDLITSINDEGQATMITSKLLKWTEEKNIHIITVLHQNKSDVNARGHIGTEIVNKAQTVLSVTKSPDNKDISIVDAEFCRDIDPEPFAFTIDQGGLPQIMEDWRPKKKGGKEQSIELKPYQIFTLLNECFTKSKELGYGELQREIQFVHKKIHHKHLPDRNAKDIITQSKHEGWIVQMKVRGNYELGQFNS